jgi:hypothetical protein
MNKLGAWIIFGGIFVIAVIVGTLMITHGVSFF